ncbi:MAG: LacI family DNA-binding transcriptional regulator [Chloroflexota bacterium]
MTGKVTISQIAKMCGVSPATVSLALNNKPGISEETRSRIVAAARELGYLPSAGVSVRRARALSTIGMVVKTEPDLLPPANPFYSQVIVGVDDACRDMGINLLFAMLPVDRHNRPVSAPPLLVNSAVDGLLMVGAFVDETIDAILGERVPPIVLVDGYSDTESYDAVVSDNFGGAYQAVEYLIEQGHRHIGLIGSEPDCYPSLAERRHGYLRALKEHDIGETYLADFNVNRSQGGEETAVLLTAHPEVTALFCVNDNVAVGAMQAAHRLGRQVPSDLAIVGYDDTYLATSVSPALTTMHVDTRAMGRAAVHLLALRLEKPDAARSTLIVHPNLIVRDSSG